ncbi:hypothetical protein Lalb_Chr25g0279501 [Lupinus albus]|uniref:Uncharacterized protein n=1 Tax=Lupinus albus TaxID=3870 RepID=A0A6A4N1R1_LUPAL|nr:hypothetical protein Lalb_Chr25g0279501 [Lupinus albus]
MVKDNLKKPALTAFTRNGDYVAILSADGTAKVNSLSSHTLTAIGEMMNVTSLLPLMVLYLSGSRT